MFRTFATVLPFVFIAACAGTEGDDDQSIVAPVDSGVVGDVDAGAADAGTPDAGTADAGPPPVGFADVESIFTLRCAPCHEVGNMRRRIIVTDYDRIVDRPSRATQMPYVTPNEPDNSWIYRKITNTHRPVCTDRGVSTNDCGGVMPTRDGTALTPAQIETVRAWIAGGAVR